MKNGSSRLEKSTGRTFLSVKKGGRKFFTIIIILPSHTHNPGPNYLHGLVLGQLMGLVQFGGGGRRPMSVHLKKKINLQNVQNKKEK